VAVQRHQRRLRAGEAAGEDDQDAEGGEEQAEGDLAQGERAFFSPCRSGADEAEKHLKQLAELGLDLEKTAAKLLDDGILAFAQPYDALLAAIEQKRNQFSS
ncbi:MAG: hypothetical protein R6U55_08835, partial [Desulfovermiculus sp.]